MPTSYLYPRLFVQRVALYKSFSLGDCIREIKFERGLNLIIGEDAQKGFPNLGGHSVGKTTLCRLIRHCLGESTFAPEEDQQAIRDNFPSGWVGCEVEIDAVPWAVLIPFTRTSKDIPLAAQHETLVSLFDLEKSDNQYRQYQEALDSLRPPQAASPWAHYLAWLTRDQEAIQGNYWEWRSSISESGTSLPKSHDNRALLVRAVLGLKADEEDDLLQEIKRIEHHITIHEGEKKAQEQSLQNRVRHALEILRQHVDFALPEPHKDAKLPSLLMDSFFQVMEQEIEKADKEHQEARNVLLLNKTTETRLSEKLLEIQAILSQKQQAAISRAPDEDRQEYSAAKEYLEAVKDPMSCVGGILISDCERVQSLKSDYEKLLSKRNGTVLQFKTKDDEKRFKENCKLIEMLEKEYDINNQYLESIEKERENLTSEEKNLYTSHAALCRKCESLKEHWNTLEQAWSTLCGGAPDETTRNTEQALKELQEEKAGNELLISRLRFELGDKITNLEQIFDAVVKNTISESCRGSITPDGDKLNFSVKSYEKPLRKGAINLVSTIAGDVACMLSALGGENYHPGFVIHDSPRNLELSPEKYFNLLSYIVRIATESEEQNIPFQYIASMTSNIDKEWEQFVRIRLASDPQEKLLFKDRLLPRQQHLV